MKRLWVSIFGRRYVEARFSLLSNILIVEHFSSLRILAIRSLFFKGICGIGVGHIESDSLLNSDI